MGVYSTVEVTRKEAERAIQSKLFSDATNEEVANALFALLSEVDGRMPHNFTVVPEGTPGTVDARYLLGLNFECDV
jgi:hypothetical protein